MSAQKLKNAPLKEVVCEIYWEGITPLNDMPVDPGFENAIGKFQERIKEIAPIQKRKLPGNARIRVFAAPVLQYWKGELQFPVIQHGPGLLTVNDTEANYEWQKTYLPLVTRALDKLIDSYERPLKFKQVRLKYMDVVDVPDGDVHKFVAENLQTQISFSFPAPGPKAGFNLMQEFKLEDQSFLQLQINSGINNRNKTAAVIWNTTVSKKASMTREEILTWLDNAHSITSDIFKKMLKPEYYDSLDK